MKNILSRLAALERRLDHSAGPTLTVIFADGTSKTISTKDAIDLFKNGEAVRAESRTGDNGFLPDLLTALAETQ